MNFMYINYHVTPQTKTRFLTTFSASGKRVFTIQQTAINGSQRQRQRIPCLLVRKGWLQRLERGLFMIIPLEAGPERLWSEMH
jgi:predicted transcriptional regulator of viral defense system